LPPEQNSELRWQYWLARALTSTHLGSERARLAYQALAEERNYYGFLAAAHLGKEARMNGAPHRVDRELLAALQRRPAVGRALELYAVGDLLNARREWFALLPQLDPAEQFHAALLAQEVGWVAQGIFTANAADLRDNLELRFPVAYADVFQRISHSTAVPQPFLLAVARQESAFDPRARSSANARGLMQLMHPTASLVAKRIGITAPSTTDLYDPGMNVELGGHHLARLLARYGERRPLAAAAYNAGEHRVDRWVRERSGTSMDIWIESIPFRETRNYVKNVLAFTQVYGQLLGKSAPMLESNETALN
jgi:soluble lytic murein transglycosylase